MVFELKMDLGFQRNDFFPRAKKQAALLKKLKDGCCSITGEPRTIDFAGGLEMNFVIFSGANISARKMRAVEDRFAAADAPGPLYILSGGAHPNDKGVTTVNDEAFGRLKKKLKALKRLKRSGI
jgi:hypothetical protein